MISLVATKTSNRSHKPGVDRELLASGLIILGWPTMNVGSVYNSRN